MDNANQSTQAVTQAGQPAPIVVEAPLGAFGQTFRALHAEIDAVKSADLLAVNVNVASAVITVRGAAPRLQARRAEIEKIWRSFDFTTFDKIEAYAMATQHAESVYMYASQPSASMPELQRQASETINVLLADASALSHRGFIDPKRLEDVRVGPGYKDTAFQLLGVVNLLREVLPRVAGHTAIEAHELLEAEALVDRFTVAVAQRNGAPVVVGQAQLTRQRAFTLMVNAYELGRSAVQFLRRDEGDADEIAPSIYAGRSTRKKASADEAQVMASVDASASAHVALPSGVASTSGATPLATGPLLPALQASYPGNDPFKLP